MILTKSLFVIIISCMFLEKLTLDSSLRKFMMKNVYQLSSGSILCSLNENVPGDGFYRARVVSKYCFHHYRELYSQFFIALHELLERDERDEWNERSVEYLVEMGKSQYHDSVVKESSFIVILLGITLIRQNHTSLLLTKLITMN